MPVICKDSLLRWSSVSIVTRHLPFNPVSKTASGSRRTASPLVHHAARSSL